MKHLVLWLVRQPGQKILREMSAALEEELGRGTRVFVYALDEAVELLRGSTFGHWSERGAVIYVCAMAARKHGLTWQEPVLGAGLTVLGDLLRQAEDWWIFDLDWKKTKMLSVARGLIIQIESDPGMEARAAEGLRVAAGLKAQQMDHLSIGLRLGSVAQMTWDNPHEGNIQDETLWIEARQLWLETADREGTKESAVVRF
jgi:hypothetical protein